MKEVFNSLEFDSINSLDYGVYITGESVYDAPERDVEAIEIVGRNGDYLLDKGRWKNMDVTYHCGTFGVDQEEFARKIRSFRNQLASRRGYKRIVDTYNPTEYRLGTFKTPVEVESASMKRAGEFDVTFNCKPQRYLMSGEAEQPITSGQSLYNPTLYDASPLLMVEGYGNIEFNGYSIDLRYVEQGDITLVDKGTATGKVQFNLNSDLFNSGDSLTMGKVIYSFVYRNTAVPSSYVLDSSSVTAQTGDSHINVMANGGGSASIDVIAVEQTTTAGQTAVSNSIHYELSLTFKHPTTEGTMTVSTIIDVYNNYYPAVNRVKYEIASATLQRSALSGFSIQYDPITAVSTALALGHPTYIDCEIGEAYMIQSGEYVPLNRYIDLGSDLPTLSAGDNVITFDNTVTSLKIIPRWWVL